MHISLTEAYKKEAGLALILCEGDRIQRHSLFTLLKAEDRDYLVALTERLPVKNRTHVVLLPSGTRAMVVGLGKRKELSHRKAFLLIRQVILTAKREGMKSLQVASADFEVGHEKWKPEVLIEAIATHAEMANFEFNVYKEVPPEGFSKVENLYVFRSSVPVSLARALKQGSVIGEEINKARFLSNTPGSDMTPHVLAEAAEAAGKAAGFSVKVLNEVEMKKLGMGGVLGVAQGSVQRPKFIVMEYLKGKKSEKPVVLVGKGVTFDTGGLSLKPTSSMYDDPMHMDMSGGAAVIHVMSIMARLKIKKNIIGLVPAVENMPSGSSYRPGDILRSMSGKTIEVANTDAEGRIILADGLTYAQKMYDPRLVIDIATLTGAAMVALGHRASAILMSDAKLESPLRRVAEETGDFIWPLPLWSEYEDDIRGHVGDVLNTGRTRYGGAITAAAFLWQFIKDKRWIHLDIAPRMVAGEGDYLARGAAGAGISLLAHFLLKA